MSDDRDCGTEDTDLSARLAGFLLARVRHAAPSALAWRSATAEEIRQDIVVEAKRHAASLGDGPTDRATREMLERMILRWSNVPSVTPDRGDVKP